MYVRTEKQEALTRDMHRLGIDETELDESFILGSGPGGQKVNKSSVCVRLVHRKSGLTIKCNQTRSRALNRYYARKQLCERLDARICGAASKRQQAREKIRRQKRRRSRRQRERMLADKRHHSLRKETRKRVSPDEE